MLHNMLKCQEKPSGVYKMQQTTGAYQRSTDPLADGEGLAVPSPRTPPPLSAFQALRFGPLGLAIPRREFSNPLPSKILHTALIRINTPTGFE